MLNDKFGDERKAFEDAYTSPALDWNTPFIARLDGKSFHTYTRGLYRPFDENLSYCMQNTAASLVEETGARLAYTQSDEITLFFVRRHLGEQAYLKGKIQKLASVLASTATAHFNQLVREHLVAKRKELALFDCRVWSVPDLDECKKVLSWRYHDARKNSVSMAAQEYYSDNSLHGKKTSDKLQLLLDRGIDWNEYPDHFKTGTFIKRESIEIPIPEDQKHWKSNEGLTTIRRHRTVLFYDIDEAYKML